MRCESAGLESCVLHLQLVQGCAHDLNQARIRLSPVAMLLGKNCPDSVLTLGSLGQSDMTKFSKISRPE